MISFGGIIRVQDKYGSVSINTNHISTIETGKYLFPKKGEYTQITMSNGEKIRVDVDPDEVHKAFADLYSSNCTRTIDYEA